jgi:shikimate dehydrogenase
LLEKCPQLIIANRHGGRGLELLQQLQEQFRAAGTENPRLTAWKETELEAALAETDLVVNATSTGLDAKAASVLPARLLRPELLVLDTVYGAGCVKFQREVEAAGARWSDGLGMLLHQGAEAFSLWTQRTPPLEIMRSALQSVFSASRE